MAKIMIVYHSQQYGNTAKMAECVAEGCRQVPGTEVTLVNTNKQRVDMQAFAACDGLALGSPDYFSYVAGGIKQFFDDAWIARKAGATTGDKPYVGFMSHGGGGRALTSLEKLAQSMQYASVAPCVTCQRAPDASASDACRALGRALAEKVK